MILVRYLGHTHDSIGQAGLEQFRRFVNVTSDVVYQISADWRELRSLWDVDRPEDLERLRASRLLERRP